MASRDVELIIRAKDTASSAIKKLKRLLGEAAVASEALSKGGDEAAAALGKFKAALADADKIVKGGGFRQMADQLKAARRSLEGLRAKVRDTAESIEKMKAAQADAEAAARKFAAAERDLARRIEGRAATISKLEANLQKLSAAERKAARDLENAQKKEATQKSRLAVQKQALRDLEREYKRLAAAVGAVDKPTKRLVSSLEAAGRSLDRQRKRVRDTEQKLSELAKAQRNAARDGAKYQARAERLRKTLDEKKKVLAALKAEQKGIQSAQRAAAQDAGKFASKAEQAAQSLKDLKNTVSIAEKEFADLRRTYREAGSAAQAFLSEQKKVAAALGAQVEAAIRRQKRAMLEAKREWKVATEAVRQHARTLAETREPSAAMRAEMERLKGKAAGLKSVFEQQRAALHAMGVAYRKSGTDAKALEAALDRIGAIQKQAQSDSGKIRSEMERLGITLGRASREGNRLDQSLARLRHSVTSLKTAAAGATQQTSLMRQALRAMGIDARKSLSTFQRLRGQVLSLVAAYGGLFGAIRGVAAVRDAQIQLDGIINRLSALTDGNMPEARREFELIKRVAQELGLEIGGLAQEYTKFALSTKGTALQGAKTRQIFRDMAVAVRVAGLDAERTKRVFNALAQIASKGVVQMEELRQQLGDNLPGAIKIMAEAAGYGESNIEDFFKAVQRGEIRADALVQFAAKLREIYGPQLEGALQRTAAAYGRFENAVTLAKQKIAELGAEEGLIRMYDGLAKFLGSGEFEKLAEVIGKAIRGIGEAVVWTAENWRGLTAAFAAFAALGLVRKLIRLHRWLRQSQVVTGTLAAAQAALGAQSAAAATKVGRLTGAMRALAVVMRAVNPWMLALSVGLPALAAAFTLNTTRVRDMDRALVDHREMLRKVRQAYDDTHGALDKWRKKMGDLSKERLDVHLKRMEQALRDFQERFITDIPNKLADVDGFAGAIKDAFRFGAGLEQATKIRAALKDLTRQFMAGEISATQFKDAMARLVKEMDLPPEFQSEIEQSIDKLREYRDSIGETRAVLEAMHGDTEAAAEALERVGRTFSDAAEQARAFSAALAEMRNIMAPLTQEFDAQSGATSGLEQKLDSLAAAYRRASDAALGLEERLLARQTYEQGARQIRDLAAATGGIDGAAAPPAARSAGGDSVPGGTYIERLVSAVRQGARELGVPPEWLLGIMSYETSGTLRKWKRGPRTKWGVHRGLIQWGEPQARQYGVSASTPVEQQVMAAVRFIRDRGFDRRKGHGLANLYAAINAGNADRVWASDAAAGGRPGSVLWKVQNDLPAHLRKAMGLLERYSGETVRLLDKSVAQLGVVGKNTDRTARSTNAFQRVFAKGVPIKPGTSARINGVRISADSNTYLKKLDASGRQLLADLADTYKKLGIENLKLTHGVRYSWMKAARTGARKSAHFEGKALDVGMRGLTRQQREAVVREMFARGYRRFGAYQWGMHFDSRRRGAPVDAVTTWGATFRSGSTPRWLRDLVSELRRERPAPAAARGASPARVGARRQEEFTTAQKQMLASLSEEEKLAYDILKMRGRLTGTLKEQLTLARRWAATFTDADKAVLKDQLKSYEEAQKAAEKRAEVERKFDQSITDRLERARLEKSLQDETLVKREQALAIAEAEQRAARQGLVLTEQQKAKIREEVRLRLEGKQAAQDAREAATRAAQEAEAIEVRINQLLQQRKQLVEEMKAATLGGDADRAAELAQRIEVLNQEIAAEQQKLTAAQLLVAQRQAEAEAKARGTEVDQRALELERQRIQMAAQRRQEQEQFNLLQQQAEFAEQRVNDLLQQRQLLMQQYKLAEEQGDQEKMMLLEQQIQQVNMALQQAAMSAANFHQQLGGPNADTSILKMQTVAAQAQNFQVSAQQNYFSWKRVGDLFVNRLAGAFDQFAQAVANGEKVGEAARKAFLRFAADFLRQIAQMIIKQALFNMLRGFGIGGQGGGGGGFLGGLFGAGHTGGVVGSRRIGIGNPTRRVPVGVFAAAERYHTGGLVGLAPNEVPAILKKGEEVLTQDDPRHVMNGGAAGAAGAAGASPVNVKVVNTFDPGEFVSEGLDTPDGQQALLNFIRANPSAVKQALEG